MTVKELTEKHNAVVAYLQQQELDHADEIATLDDEVAALKSRIDALESRLDAIE